MIKTLLFIVAIIIIYIALFRVLKSLLVAKLVFRIFSIAFIVLIILSIGGGLLLFNDANDFQKNFASSSNLFLLQEKETLITGITLGSSRTVVELSPAQLADAQSALATKDYATLREGYYKVFVIDSSIFDTMKDRRIEDKNVNLTLEQLKIILLSADTRQTFIKYMAQNTGESEEKLSRDLAQDDEELRAYLFSYVVADIFNPAHIDTFLTALKQGTVKVYDETFLFKMMKLIPTFVMSDIVNSAVANIA